MAQNAVAANLLMIVLVIGGLLMLPRIKQEVFPEFSLDLVLVQVEYPGASPAEVEEGVVLAIEEAVRDVEGIKEVRATASEGMALVTVELLLGVDSSRALADIKSAVDRVQSFPEDIERPIISLAENRHEVLSVVVHGVAEETHLRSIAEKIRDDLINLDGITVVELYAARPLEISVEVPLEEQRRYGLTLDQVAQAIESSSVEIPGGGVKTEGGEILVRTAARRDYGAEFGDITVLSRPDGSEIKLREIATIDDGFQDTDQEAYFNGQRAIMVRVFRVADQTPISVSDVVHEYLDEARPRMPPGVELSVWSDQSEFFQERIDLLMRNARLGLVLVLLVLGLFLELGLAIWVTLGIPTSFIGALLFMPSFDASINMISLFAFIVTLGLVVDDAIVVGEAVYARRAKGTPMMRAAVEGVREVAAPVIFSIATTIIAFAPMLFVPGPAGKFFRLIPVVVISVLLISLTESLLVLPAHLGHENKLMMLLRGAFLAPFRLLRLRSASRVPSFLHSSQQRFSSGVENFTSGRYAPWLRVAVKNRFLTVSVCVALLLATFGLIGGGRVKFTFLPKVDGDVVVADLRMPFGTPAAETRDILRDLLLKVEEVLQDEGGVDRYSRGIFSQLGDRGILVGGPGPRMLGVEGAHVGEVAVFLVPSEERPFSSRDLSLKWRQRIGEIPGAESLKFNFSTGPTAGAPIDIELIHTDLEILEEAAAELAQRLGTFPGVFDIDSGFSTGKEQLDLRLEPTARALGLTEAELARQVRSSFYGAEAVRQQRGREELRVFARLPDEQRKSEYDIESLLLRTPEGGEIPLLEAAQVRRGTSYTEINRREGRRVVNVTAEVDPSKANANEVIAELEKTALPDIMKKYDGLGFDYGGEQREQRNTLDALGDGFSMSLLAIFGLLAIAFRSYLQPIIIMVVIPFGLVGAVVGHVLMGYDLSLMSLMGIVALSGVVVNDSLILIVAVNDFRSRGMSTLDAVIAGGERRFRPIVLTSLTTFFGLMPMIFETSVQARFLIPMAISLGFGVLFATLIMLVLVPAVYVLLEDARGAVTRLVAHFGRRAPAVEPGE